MGSVYAGKFQGEMRDLSGRALVGAKAELRIAGSTALATLYNGPVVIADAEAGDLLANPGMASTGIPAAAGEGKVGVDAGANVTCYASTLDDDGELAEYELWATYRNTLMGPFTLTLVGDSREPPRPGSVTTEMIDDAGIAQDAVAGLTAALASKQPTIPPGTYVPTTPNTILRGVYVKPASGDGIQYVAASGNDANDGLSMGDAKATIAAAKTALSVGGGQIHFVGTKAAPIGAWATNLSLIGRGKEASLLTVSDLTADVFDLTGVNNAVFKDFTINGTAQRTAGAFFKVGGLHHLFENIKVSSPFQGFNITGSDVELRNILLQDYNATWAWDYAIACLGASTAVRMFGITGSSATGTAGMNKALIYLGGSTSSINMDTVITSTEGVIGLLIERGHWVYVDKCEFESGLTAPAVKVIGGSARLTDLHALGLQGVLIDPTSTRVEGVRISGGEIVKCAREGVKVVAGGFGCDNLKVQGVDIADVSQEANNTYSGVLIGAGVSKFDVSDIVVRSGSVNGNNGNVPKHAVEIAAGASNDYTIKNNRLSAFGTSMISDGGTGTRKTVASNSGPEGSIGVDRPVTTFASGTTTFTFPHTGTYLLEGVGAGGGGGGGGSGHASTQVGGGGGAAGVTCRVQVAKTAGDTISVVVGAGGTGGTAAVAGGAGGAGGVGGDTTFGGTTLVCKGGPGGQAGGAASATQVNGGAYGAASGTVTSTPVAGCGGFGNSGRGGVSGSPVDLAGCGGGGGAPASATNGGTGGAGGVRSGTVGPIVSNGAAPTVAGTDGAAGTVVGAGGGGGGGGAPTGAGGAGGAGSAGFASIRQVA